MTMFYKKAAILARTVTNEKNYRQQRSQKTCTLFFVNDLENSMGKGMIIRIQPKERIRF